MKTKTAKPVTQNETVETHLIGPHGEGSIKRLPSGARILEINTGSKETPGRILQIPSQQIHLNGKSLEETLEAACMMGSPVPTFNYTEIKGPKALICLYELPGDEAGATSYASVIKTGVRPLKFSLSRIDLKFMGSSSPLEALRKTAFSTGSIRLKP